MTNKVTLGSYIGANIEEAFIDFDLTEIQDVLDYLRDEEPSDIAHAEMLQQKSLRGADILIEYMGKIVKTIGFLETKINKTKNKVSLEYKDPNGGKITADTRKYAGESSEEVADLQDKLSRAKASKMVLEKKYDLLIKFHYFQKEISTGLRKTILGYAPISEDKAPGGSGWE